MSFNRQENVYFTNNLNSQKIRLLEVFNAMNLTKDRDYTCDPISCASYYTAINGENSKNIALQKEKKIYGFKIKEQDKILKSFDELEFYVDVYVGQHCINQINIDLFDDGIVDFYNIKPRLGPLTCGSEFYPATGRNQGCFDEEDSEGDIPIGKELYCEHIKNIPPAASYEIGGDINVIKANGNLAFAMYPIDGGDAYGGGWLNRLPQGPNRELSIIINHSSREKFDALICVYTEERFAEHFTIKTNEDDKVCGLVFEPGEEVSNEDFELDFDLFVKPRGYEGVTFVKFDKDTYKQITDRNLKEDVFDYLNRTYGLNCSGINGCVIPFSIWGLPSEDQQLLYGGKLRYKIGSGTNRVQNPAMIYDITEKPAKVSAGWTKIQIEKMKFKVPSVNGRHNLKLFLGGEEIFEKIINVDIGFAFEITPRFAYIGREVVFNARSNVNVTRSIWDFGDGTSPINVQGKSAKHKFESEGEYNVKVTLIREGSSSGPRNSTKRFKVIVGDAKTSADLILKDYEARITNLESDISKYPSAVKNSLISALAIDARKSLIQSKRQEFRALDQDAPSNSYISIIDDLLDIDLPDSVYTSASGTLPLEIEYESTNMAHIMEIARVDRAPSDEDELKARVFSWMVEHYDASISFEEISAKKDAQETKILKNYKITIVEKKEPESDSAYLIIGYPKNTLTFISAGDKFRETSISGGAYVDIKTNSINNVEFIIVGSNAPEIMRLGAYISPPPSSLGINEKQIVECWIPGNCDQKGKFLWKRFILGITIVLFLFLTTYILLQTWYKHNYEKHLFPNSNDLYNLLNFIYNSRRNGLKDSEIRQSLRERKWTSEQITYAFKKLEGKRTGMWEIPLFKFVENRKVRKELEKQQGGRPLDIRFIKRPNL